MGRYGTYIAYLIFPLAGVLVALLIPPDKLPLRILVAAVISALGVIAADADVRWDDARVAFRAVLRFADRPRRALFDAREHFMIVALILMILSAVEFSPMVNTNNDFTTPVVLMLAGLAAAWIALYRAAPLARIAAPNVEALQPPRGNLIWTALGVVLLLAAGEAAGHALGIGLLQQVSLLVQALLFYGGIGLVVLGLSGLRLDRVPRLPRLRPVGLRQILLSNRRRETLIVLVIFIGALVIRTWNLQNGPRISADEAPAIDGIQAYYGGQVGLVAPPSVYISSLVYPQWQGVLISILGRSLATLRLTSAIVGALTVVVIYFLGRDLFDDQWMGLIAALVLMTFPPHIHFSRLVHLHIADALFGSLSIWFLIRGLRWNRRIDWALAGASLGMTQYFFEAGRLFYIPLALAWLGGALMLWGALAILKRLYRLSLARRLTRWALAVPQPSIPTKGILIAVLACVMVAMPTYYAIFSEGADANPRLTDSGGFNLIAADLQSGLTPDAISTLANRFLFPFTVYVHQPELAVLYGGDQPMMLVYVVPFFLLGLAYLLWRWRTMAVVLALWILGAGVGNGLMRDSAVFARWHVVFPAVALVVAVALRYLLPSIWSSVSKIAAAMRVHVPCRMAGLLVGGVVAFLMIGQVVYYYGWHVPLLEKQTRLNKPYPDVFDMAMRALSLPNSTDIYLIGDPVPDDNVPRSWIDFLTTSDPTTLNYYALSAEDVTSYFISQLPKDRNLAFFVDPTATYTVSLLQDRLGCIMQSSPYPIDPPDKGFLLCYVSQYTAR